MTIRKKLDEYKVKQREEKMNFLRRELAKGNITKSEFDKRASYDR